MSRNKVSSTRFAVITGVVLALALVAVVFAFGRQPKQVVSPQAIIPQTGVEQAARNTELDLLERQGYLDKNFALPAPSISEPSQMLSASYVEDLLNQQGYSLDRAQASSPAQTMSSEYVVDLLRHQGQNIPSAASRLPLPVTGEPVQMLSGSYVEDLLRQQGYEAGMADGQKMVNNNYIVDLLRNQGQNIPLAASK